jgi:hypothetical protein
MTRPSPYIPQGLGYRRSCRRSPRWVWNATVRRSNQGTEGHHLGRLLEVRGSTSSGQARSCPSKADLVVDWATAWGCVWSSSPPTGLPQAWPTAAKAAQTIGSTHMEIDVLVRGKITHAYYQCTVLVQYLTLWRPGFLRDLLVMLALCMCDVDLTRAVVVFFLIIIYSDVADQLPDSC